MMDDVRSRIQGRMPQRAGAWYSIANQADDTATVRIYDDIGYSLWGGISEDDFARDLDRVSASRLEVQVSSSGGDVFAGIAIYNALRAHPAEVTVRVDSLAASIASVIVQAGDRRTMLTGSQMMVHPAWGAAVGPSADMREFADLLDRQTDIIAGIYAERSGRDVDVFRQMLDGPDVWLTADEAVAAGLADDVVVPGAGETPTLHDEISQAAAAVRAVVESASRVASLRADAGKTLSRRNLDGLEGLKGVLGELDGLLGGQPVVEDDDGAVVDDIRREHLKMLARLGG